MSIDLQFKEYKYKLGWDRTKLQSSRECPLALDTETDCVDLKREVANLILISVSDGTNHFILEPKELDDFLLEHKNEWLVTQNGAFDFWVIDKYIRQVPFRPYVKNIWWRFVNEGRYKDTMLLDQLLVLATGEGEKGGFSDYVAVQNLSKLAKKYKINVFVDKDDPYRTTYEEIRLKDWKEVAKNEQGRFDYAIIDAIATHQIYKKQYQIAYQLMQRAGYGDETKGIYKNAIERYGILAEDIQVKASIVLSEMSRRGIYVDQAKIVETESNYRSELSKCINILETDYSGLIQHDKKGNIKCSKVTGTPSISHKELVRLLTEIGEQIVKDDPLFVLPRSGKKNGVCKSIKVWHEWADAHPFLTAWSRYAELVKLTGFFSKLQEPVIRPRYNTMVRTGRTSCTQPNLQQMPRRNEFRSLFIPRQGYKLQTIDYSAIELRTLATVCYKKFGFSKLGDVLKADIDPHAHTASMVEGISFEEFLSWKQKDDKKDKFKYLRQAAKAINFGVPGGLGATKLCAYAKANYGVTLDIDQASAFRDKLIYDIYPELSDIDGYLADNTMEILAQNLGITVDDCWKAFCKDERHGWIPKCLIKIVSGNPVKKDGTPYKENFVSQMWELLLAVCRRSGRIDTSRLKQIAKYQGSVSLAQSLFFTTATTLTGRLRGGVNYTNGRNTPFQGLAADGAKVAMWNLLCNGFNLVAFVHDEVLIEVPIETAEEDAKKVEKILTSSMYNLLDQYVPVSAEYSINDCWKK